MNNQVTESTQIAMPVTVPALRIDHGLLFASTAVAALFCYLYITKPVISITSATLPASIPLAVPPPAVAAPTETAILPHSDHLPGDDSQTESPPESKPATVGTP